MEKKMTFSEFNEVMFDARKEGKALAGVIVYKASNWKKEYNLDARSYVVSNQCNYYDVDKISQALWGTSIDGSDKNVRLDYYDWEVDYCYILK